ncbi:MAG: protein BatD [Pseudomonadales bacterium]|nr:protein BatD [Pseudomonadales bacterium]
MAASKFGFAVCALLLLCSLTLSNLAIAESFTASVDRNNIVLNESFELTLSIDQQVFFGEPELDSLADNFRVMSKRRSSQYRSVNGETHSSTDWVVSLKPKKTGYLVIAPIEFKGLVSQAIAIEVAKVQVAKAGQSSQLFFETIIDRDALYLQAQLLYKVRLYTSVTISRANITEPKLDQAIIHSLGNQLVYETVRNGIRYQVHEWNYALFPQQAGTLVIPAPVLSATISDRSSMYGRSVSITTENQSVSVQAIPASYPSVAWVATPALSASQLWEPTQTQLMVGDSITRTVEFNIEDNEIALIADLNHESVSGIKTYPDKPQVQNRSTNKGIQGQRIDKIAYVMTQAGTFTLPDVEISWWNTKTNQLQTTQLPGKTFSVADAAIPESSSPTLPIENAVASQREAAPEHTEGSAALPTYSDETTTRWMLSCAALLALLLLVTVLWWRSQRRIKALEQQLSGQSPNNNALANTPSGTEKTAFEALQLACTNDAPAQVWNSLLLWAQRYWQTDYIHSCQDIFNQLPEDSELASVIAQLDVALFGSSSEAFSAGERLVELIAAQRKINPQKGVVSAAPALKPLYPL